MGFQLSTAAKVGLVFCTKPLEGGSAQAISQIASTKRAEKIVGLISEASIVTLTAQITMTPIISCATLDSPRHATDQFPDPPHSAILMEVWVGSGEFSAGYSSINASRRGFFLVRWPGYLPFSRPTQRPST
jgi:hypothetical protein